MYLSAWRFLIQNVTSDLPLSANVIKIIKHMIFMFCLVTALMVQLNPTYSQSIALATGSLCVGSDIVFALQGSCTGTTWSVTNGGVISSNDNNSAHIKWNTATSAIVTASSYCNGNDWQSYSLNVTINPTATSSVSISIDNTNVCQGGGTIGLTATATNGGSTPYYNFYVDGSSTPVYGGPSNSYLYSINGLSVGSHSVYVAMISSYPCITQGSYISNSSTQSFNVTARSTFSVATMGPNQICSGSPNAQFFANVSNAVENMSYQWYLNGYPINEATTNPYTINSLNAGNTVYCSVSSDYWCVNTPVSSNPYTVNISNSVTPTVGVQVLGLNYCIGQQMTFTAASSYITGSSSYAWYRDGNLLSNTGSSISLTASNSGGPGLFYSGSVVMVVVSGLSGTCLTSATAQGTTSGTPFTLYTLPIVTSSVSNQAICSQNQTSIMLTNPNGISGTVFNWTASASNTSGASSGSGSSIIQTLSSADAINNGTVVYTITPSANGCLGQSISVTVTVKPKPTVSSSVSSQTICLPGHTSITLSGGVAGTIFNWTASPSNATGASNGGGASIVQALNSLNGTSSGTVTYTISPSANGCTGNPISVVVTVQPKPTISSPVTAQAICSASQTSITLTNPNGVVGTTYTVAFSAINVLGAVIVNGGGPSINQTLNSIDGVNPGTVTYAVTPVSNGCAGTPISVTETVKPTPAFNPMPSSVSIWSGAMVVYTPAFTIPGTTYNWISTVSGTVTGAASSGSTPINNLLFNASPASGNVTYAFTPTYNGCNGFPQNLVATVNANPIVTVSRTANTQILDAGAGFTTYSWKNSINTVLATTRTYSTFNADSLTINVTKTGVMGTGSSKFVLTQFAAINENYIVSNTILVNNIANPVAVGNLSPDQRAQSVQYFDGLGRPQQIVNTWGSPLKKDIVQPVLFDVFGREPTKYLPYAAPEGSGWIKINPVNEGGIYSTSDHYNAYNNAVDKIADDDKPYSVTSFEPSPLNRVTEQGAAGTAWQPGTNHTLKKIYTSNGASDVYFFRYDAASNLISLTPSAKFYPASQLYANVTTDEHNNDVIEYVDKVAHTVCKKVQYGSNANGKLYACTYYLYDDFGNLIVVLPPEAVRNFE